MTIEFDMTLLEVEGIGEPPERVTSTQVDALVAYSTAVSLKRIADALERGMAPVITEVLAEEPTIALKRRAEASIPAAKKRPAVTPGAPLPADFTAWDGAVRLVEDGRKKVGPIEPLLDVIVWYRRGKSSGKLSAGQVNWEHTGGPDDVLGYRVVGDARDPERSVSSGSA